jgi:putative ABC transport system ATP-binding protein
MTNVIELDGVEKIYNGGAALTALADVSLRVETGEFTAVMGPSGSGKSTLLNLVAGLDRPSAGTVRVCGHDLSQMSEAQLARFRRTSVGVIFQFFNLLNNLTVLENILVPAELAGLKRSDARRRADELLTRLSLSDKEEAYPAELSGGQRQRVAIARALINRPSLLLADEPTGALDSRSGDQIMELLQELNREGQTIVLVTHDAKLAARYAGRIVSVRDGRITDDTVLAPAHQASAASLVSFTAEEVLS